MVTFYERVAPQAQSVGAPMAVKKWRVWRITMMSDGTETLIGQVRTDHIAEKRLKHLLELFYAKYILSDERIFLWHLNPKALALYGVVVSTDQETSPSDRRREADKR
jgi:hypothetical protein